VTFVTRECLPHHINRNTQRLCWWQWRGGEKEGIMVNQDYLFAVLLIMCAMLMIHWGMNHTWRH
jgi:hypothetical protein